MPTPHYCVSDFPCYHYTKRHIFNCQTSATLSHLLFVYYIMSDLLSSMILVLIQGIEPWSSTYEVDVLAIELDERIWWTERDSNPHSFCYEQRALTIMLSVQICLASRVNNPFDASVRTSTALLKLVPHSGVEPEAPRLWDAGDETASCGILAPPVRFERTTLELTALCYYRWATGE